MLRGNGVSAATGSAGVSFPFWDMSLSSGWSILIGLAGGLVLLLTIWDKVLQIRLKNRDLRKDS